jgi:hypothetical protein
LIAELAIGRQVLPLFWPGLTCAADEVFEARQLLNADGTTCVQLSRRNADLGAKTEFAPVGELRRSVVQ